MNKTLLKIILAVVIFCVSAGAYYYPIYHKGYSLSADYLSLMMARNYASSGTYMTEDANGANPSSQNIKLHGVVTGISNPLTPIIYGHIFKYFGFHPNVPFYLSIIAFSLFNVLVFLLLSKIFSVGVGFIGGVLGAFIPAMVVGAIIPGFYEWAMLFFIGALWLFLGSKNGPFKAGLVRIFFASILFALSALARNAFAISFIPFFLYDFYFSRSIKRGLLFLLPFLIIFGSTLTPYSWLGVPNGYGSTSPPFSEVGHLFRDPYSYHFEKDAYIASNFSQGKYLDRYETHFLGLYVDGYPVKTIDVLRAYYDSARIYIKQFFQIITFGGPVMIFLMLIGGWYLWSKDRRFLGLLIFWPIVLLACLIYEKSGNWDHFLEIMFAIITLSSLGVFYIYGLIKNNIKNISPHVIASIFAMLLIIQLSQSVKWRLFDDYRSSRDAPVINLVNSPDLKNIKGPVAVYVGGGVLNYYLDQDVVYFDSQTVKENLEAGKLKNVFSIYGVKSAFGFSSDLSSQIKSVLKIPVFLYDKPTQ